MAEMWSIWAGTFGVGCGLAAFGAELRKSELILISRAAKIAMQLFKDYLSRYVRDAVAFLLAFGVAAFGILPTVVITYREYAPFVYLFVGFVGLPLIFVFAAVSSILRSYHYKFVAFVIASLLMLYGFRDVLSFDPSSISPGAVNWNRVIFAQLLFITPIIYGFRERRRNKARWAMRASWE